jgi:hypothetical protein
MISVTGGVGMIPMIGKREKLPRKRPSMKEGLQ